MDEVFAQTEKWGVAELARRDDVFQIHIATGIDDLAIAQLPQQVLRRG